MIGAWVAVGLLTIVLLVALTYVVARAARLTATTEALRDELRQFKEGGFDRLISDKLRVLTDKAAQEIEHREKAIRDTEAKVLEAGQHARIAAEQFKEDFGAVKTQMTGLQELQAKVADLNDLLKPQQFRGELGEVIVRTLIADKLPSGRYEENHTFTNGKQVEFVIRLNDRLIPVDAKLPLDDYKRMRESEERQRPAFRTEFKRTVKKKIDEVKEYIQPEEGTFNFALMVIPSEAVYYDLIANKDFLDESGLYDYARARNVFLTSPSTFWAYLTALADGLRGLEIEHQAEQILMSLQTLAAKIRNFSQDEFRKIGDHLKDAAKKYDQADGTLRGIGDDLASLERMDADPLTQRGGAR